MRVREWTISFVLLLRSVSTLSVDHYFHYCYDDNTTALYSLVILHKPWCFCFQFSILKPNVQKIAIICIIFHRNTLNADISKSYYSTFITNPNFSSTYSHSKWLICCSTPPQPSKNTYYSNPTFKNSFGEKIFDLVVCTCGCVLNVFSAGVIPLHCCSFTEC